METYVYGYTQVKKEKEVCLQYKRQCHNISHLKYAFQRNYQQKKWTEEIFIITHRHTEQGIHLYQLKDFADEPIDGYFYKEELQKVSKDPNALFRVEKILIHEHAKDRKNT